MVTLRTLRASPQAYALHIPPAHTVLSDCMCMSLTPPPAAHRRRVLSMSIPLVVQHIVVLAKYHSTPVYVVSKLTRTLHSNPDPTARIRHLRAAHPTECVRMSPASPTHDQVRHHRAAHRDLVGVGDLCQPRRPLGKKRLRPDDSLMTI